jgi:Uma2 family endonuclease
MAAGTLVSVHVCGIPEAGPFDRVIHAPPFIFIEMLSPEDRTVRTTGQIDDYLSFGVRYVWIIDPGARRAFVHTSTGCCEAKDRILRTENPDVAVPWTQDLASLE